MERFKLKLLVLVVGSVFLLSCGKEGKEKDVKIEVVPESPIVLLDADSNVYFDMRFTLANGSASTVTLLALNFKIHKFSAVGSSTEEFEEVSFGAGSFDGSITVGENSCAYAFESFVPITPGQTTTSGDTRIPLTLYDPVLEGDGCPNGFTATDVRFRITTERPEDDSYNFSVEAEAIGLFGTVTSPEARFIKKFYFQTQ